MTTLARSAESLAVPDTVPVADTLMPTYTVEARNSRLMAGSVMSTSKRRSEEHTSELQPQTNLVCRLLLEKQPEPGICAGAGGPAEGHIRHCGAGRRHRRRRRWRRQRDRSVPRRDRSRDVCEDEVAPPRSC